MIAVDAGASVADPRRPVSDLVDHTRWQLPPGHALAALEWREVATNGTDLTIEMSVTPRILNSADVVQGGLLATLADIVGGFLLMRTVEPGLRYTTSDLHVTFLAPARHGPVRATATLLRRGRRSAVVRVEISDEGDDGRHVASATLTFATLPQLDK